MATVSLNPALVARGKHITKYCIPFNDNKIAVLVVTEPTETQIPSHGYKRARVMDIENKRQEVQNDKSGRAKKEKKGTFSCAVHVHVVDRENALTVSDLTCPPARGVF